MVSEELILAAQNGDREALVDILRAVERDIYKTAYYMLSNEQDARDATQDTLMRICRNINMYETKALFKTWVNRIVTNICIDYIRKRKDAVSLDNSELVIKASDDVEQQVMKDESKRDVAAAIQKLEEPYRSIVLLRYVNQYSYDEIVDTLDLPLNTVKSYLFRAKSQLQKYLKEYAKGG